MRLYHTIETSEPVGPVTQLAMSLRTGSVLAKEASAFQRERNTFRKKELEEVISAKFKSYMANYAKPDRVAIYGIVNIEPYNFNSNTFTLWGINDSHKDEKRIRFSSTDLGAWNYRLRYTAKQNRYAINPSSFAEELEELASRSYNRHVPALFIIEVVSSDKDSSYDRFTYTINGVVEQVILLRHSPKDRGSPPKNDDQIAKFNLK